MMEQVGKPARTASQRKEPEVHRRDGARTKDQLIIQRILTACRADFQQYIHLCGRIQKDETQRSHNGPPPAGAACWLGGDRTLPAPSRCR